jgi:hypothetical protein
MCWKKRKRAEAEVAFFLSMTYVIISFSLSLRRLGIGLKESNFCCWWVWYCCKALGELAPTLELGTMVKITKSS